MFRHLLLLWIFLFSVYVTLINYDYGNKTNFFNDSFDDYNPELSAKYAVPSNNTLRVMTFNIRVEKLGARMNKWVNRRHKVIETVLENSPDLIGLQEDEDGQTLYINENLKSKGYELVYTEFDYANKFSNNAIFVRSSTFRVEDKGIFWLSESPWKPSISWNAYVMRTATYALLTNRINGRTLLMVNLHLDHLSIEHRVKSSQVVQKFVENYKNEKELKVVDLVITGDFNESLGQTTHQAFRTNLKVEDSWLYCIEKNCTRNKNSFMSFHGFFGNIINNKLLKPLEYFLFTLQGRGVPPPHSAFFIDWILYRSTITPRYVKLINSHDRSGVFSSDHFPYFAVFEYINTN